MGQGILSRVALTSRTPIPTGRIQWIIESETQTLTAPIRGCARQLATRTENAGSDPVISSPRRQWTSQLGRYDPRDQRVLRSRRVFPYYGESRLLSDEIREDGRTTSGSTQTTIASRTWNSDTLPREMVLRRDRVTGRTRMVVTGECLRG